MTWFRFKGGYFWFLLLSLAACTPDEELESPDGPRTTFGIRHDKTLEDYERIATNQAPYNSADYPDFSPVVSFTYSLDGSRNYDYVASGVLVAPNWILTAGHNFFTSDEQRSPAPIAGIVVNLGNDPDRPTQTKRVAELVFHPTWLSDDDVFGNANDFCLVRLAEPITGIKPATLNASAEEIIGSTVWFCGFGDYSRQPGQNPDDYSKKHALENILDRKVAGITSRTGAGDIYRGGLVAFDFDSPDGLVNTLGDDYISPDEPLLGGGTSEAFSRTWEGGTVEGDSGGPLFSNINNQWVVIGILSGGAAEPLRNYVDGDYGDISIFTRVSTSISWMRTVIQ